MMMDTALRTEWAELRDAIEQIESQIALTSAPTPTDQMCKFLIAGEDHRFSCHPGVDPVAFIRAVWKTLCGTRQGGSTIAMQLVRTVTGRYEKTWRRKFREMILAILLTQHKDKERLPVLYLWVAYYGWRMNNFQQACLRLHINPLSLSELEAAKLIARLKYPEPGRPNIGRTRQIQCRAQHLIALTNGAEEPRWLDLTGHNGTIQNRNAIRKAH
jgi:membrane peptidoglycan carboxypeptidase